MPAKRDLPHLGLLTGMRHWSRIAQIAAVIVMELVALLLVYALVALI